MKTNVNNRNSRGFTLIEMVGVLAVIAILAALLVPKIFAAINESRYANTVASVNSVKAATMTYFGKYGKFAMANGVAMPTGGTNSWDSVLLTEGLLEKPFTPRMGDGTATVEVITDSGAEASFDFDGSGNFTTSTNGTWSVICVISNVPLVDAYELSKRIDGDTLSATNASTTSDYKGRVKYNVTSGNTGPVWIYLAHK
jgi:prepilin-type N-terminal cleavage/methylation domain-containing protein